MQLENLLAPLPSTLVTTLALMVLVLPLMSFFINLHNSKKYHGEWVASLILSACFFLSFYLFLQVWGQEAHHFRFTWFRVAIGNAEYQFTAGLLINDLSALMLVVVTLVSFLVHIYSIAYMRHDPHFIRYFAYLGLFTFSMLGIVMADNLLSIFMFWELVGLSSYLLIGFWFARSSASSAAKKAFIVNRIGDLGFLIGLMILWSQFNTLDLVALKHLMADSKIMEGQWLSTFSLGNSFGQNLMPEFWITVAGIGLFCGAVGKSAQFPLQVWLPDAMEGPTPVSALIHAATMVAAGVFLLARVFPLLDFQVLNLVAFVGATTAFMGAFAAFTQNDIKRVLAFSTVSQLGYMVMGIGVGAYEAATFHLFTHAFFKAGLFLAAGAVITALHGVESTFEKNGQPVHLDVQDMRLMGGLRKKLPFTFIIFLIASAALSGIPFFSGFLSKDAILTSSLGYARVLADGGNIMFYLVPALGFITVLMTAMYMTRQIILIFFGKNRLPAFIDNPGESLQKLKDVPWLMKLPMAILAILSFGIVYGLNPLASEGSWFLQGIDPVALVTPNPYQSFDSNDVLRNLMVFVSQDFHLSVSIGSTLLALTGILLSLYFYNPKKFSQQPKPRGVLARVSYHNWYLDKIYAKVFVTPTLQVSRWNAAIDKRIIDPVLDGLAVTNVVLAHVIGWIDKNLVDGLVNFLARIIRSFANLFSKVQNGKVQSYYIWALLSLLGLLIWVIT